MVRAILDGTKTQTRRVCLPVYGHERNNILKRGLPYAADSWAVWWHSSETDRVGCLQECPYGKPGDRLWVKETWRPSIAHSHGINSCDCGDVNVRYEADGVNRYFADGSFDGEWTMPKAANKGNVTPLFMPRWASRIFLEITDVRVQRVQEISKEDALAEGIQVLRLERLLCWSLQPVRAGLWDLELFRSFLQALRRGRGTTLLEMSHRSDR